MMKEPDLSKSIMNKSRNDFIDQIPQSSILPTMSFKDVGKPFKETRTKSIGLHPL
jgi:hypothetical protein